MRRHEGLNAGAIVDGNSCLFPTAFAPLSFGTSTSVQSGKQTKPGAFSITQLISRSNEEWLPPSAGAPQSTPALQRPERWRERAKLGHREAVGLAEHLDAHVVSACVEVFLHALRHGVYVAPADQIVD